MSKNQFIILLIILGIIGQVLSSLIGMPSLLIFTIVYGLVGFITSKLLKSLNPAKIASDIILMLTFTPIFFLNVLFVKASNYFDLLYTSCSINERR